MLCISAPTNDATVADNVTVTADISVSPQSPGIQSLQFFLDKTHLITDFAAPFTFQLPSTHFIDKTWSLSVQATMRDGFTTGPASIHLIFSNGIRRTITTANTFTPTSGSTPLPGQPFILAATGDGASGETTDVPALIALWSPNLFLYLGDVYEKGTYTEFYNWYGAEQYFGQFRAITDPVPGNHESTKAAAFGYQDYWRIGHSAPTYYSFDAAGWHFIALNANGQVRQQPGSQQYQWLVQDLNKNTAACTLAYWHQPVFSIGPEPQSHRMEPIWALLARHHVDIVLSGHDHGYQRWQPLDGKGNVDPQTGITEFVAGGGGHGIQEFITSDSRVVVGNDSSPTAFGALRFVLNPHGTTFEYVNTGGTILDSGTIGCHGADIDTNPPSIPTNLTASLDSSDHVVLNWSAATDNLGITGYTLYRNGQVVTTTNRSGLSYTDSDVDLGATYTYSVDAFDTANNRSAVSSSISATLPAQTTLPFTPIADSFIDSSNPDTNFGPSTALRLDVSPDIRSFISFDVQGLPGGHISSAILQIFSTNASRLGYDVFRVSDDTWTERDITYNNAPPFGSEVDFVQSLGANSWTTVDVAAVVMGNGFYSFGLSTSSSTSLTLSSREGAQPPQLIITLTS